jgi:hypothetical protein
MDIFSDFSLSWFNIRIANVKKILTGHLSIVKKKYLQHYLVNLFINSIENLSEINLNQEFMTLFRYFCGVANYLL